MAKEVFIALRTDGLAGSGTPTDPFDGSTDSKLDSLLFDGAKAPTNATIRFGPGVFRTKGFGGANSIATLRSGQRWIGSGIYNTTLELVLAAPGSGTPAPPPAIAVIGGANLSDIEISDMTLDANLNRQPKLLDSNSKPTINVEMKTDGINIYFGTNVRISRVRVINWGTHTPLNATRSTEGFPIYIESAATDLAGSNVIEDCIVEQPDFSPARESTILNTHSHPNSLRTLCTYRNNYLNGDYTTGAPPPPIKLDSVTYNSVAALVTIATKWPHCLQSGTYLPQDEVIIAGSGTAYDGRYKVAWLTDERVFQYAKPGLPAPPSPGNMTAQRYVPQAMRITGISLSSGDVTITTPVPHLRRADDSSDPTIKADYIRVAGVKSGGTTDNYYNGSFRIKSVTATTITYTPNPGPAASPDNNPDTWLDRWPSQMVIIDPHPTVPPSSNCDGITWSGGYAFVRTKAPHYRAPGDYVLIEGMGADPLWNGYFQVVEMTVAEGRGSRILKCIHRASAPAPATIITNYQAAALHQKFQGLTATVGFGGRAFGNRIIDVYTGGPYHDLGPGAHEPEKDLTAWNNYYHFVWVGPFSSVANRLPTYDDRQYWNTVRENIIELQPFPPGNWNISPPGGILFWGPYTTGIRSFRTLLIRDNLIRWADGVSSSGYNGSNQLGINLTSFQDGTIEDNLIYFSPQAANPISYSNYSHSPKLFNNSGPNGTPI